MNDVLTTSAPPHPTVVGDAQRRAVRLTAPGRIEVITDPLPVPGESEVRIRLEGCGVCASNLGPWAGPDWMTFPTDSGGLGHEGWGYVEKVGPGVQGLAEGQRVAFLGQSGFATHEVIDQSLVVPLPAALDGRPFPAEPLGCAMNIFRRSGISRGDRVAIVGIGFLGALLTRLASDAGAEVIAISRRDEALAMARQMGAARALPLDDAVVEEVRGHTNGRLCDVVIEAVGKQAALDLAGDLVAEGGRLVIAGYHQDGPRQVNMQQWNWRGIDVINAHERKPEIYIRGIREAIEAVATGRLDPWPLFTHSYPLDQLDMALDATRDRPDGFMKALIICN